MRKIELQDSFKLARLIKKADLKETFVNATRKGKEAGTLAEDVGIDVFFGVLMAAGSEELENEVYNFLGDIVEKEPDIIKHQSINETIEQIKQIAKENNLINFFKSVKGLMK